MSKITFRADDDLVSQLEGFDASKSEVMREALRAYLDRSSDDDESGSASDGSDRSTSSTDGAVDATATDREGEDSLDAVVAERVDAVLADRLDVIAAERRADPVPASGQQAVDVTVTVEDETASANRVVDDRTDPAGRKTPVTDGADSADDADGTGDDEPSGTCSQCGTGLTPGHVYCPNCGEKATHRVFCDCGDELRSDWAFCPGCGRRTPAADVLDQQ